MSLSSIIASTLSRLGIGRRGSKLLQSTSISPEANISNPAENPFGKNGSGKGLIRRQNSKVRFRQPSGYYEQVCDDPRFNHSLRTA